MIRLRSKTYITRRAYPGDGGPERVSRAVQVEVEQGHSVFQASQLTAGGPWAIDSMTGRWYSDDLWRACQKLESGELTR